MIVAKTEGGTLLIGLSERNLHLLREGKPIMQDIPGMPKFYIVYGITEREILDNLEAAGLQLPSLDHWHPLSKSG